MFVIDVDSNKMNNEEDLKNTHTADNNINSLNDNEHIEISDHVNTHICNLIKSMEFNLNIEVEKPYKDIIKSVRKLINIKNKQIHNKDVYIKEIESIIEENNKNMNKLREENISMGNRIEKKAEIVKFTTTKNIVLEVLTILDHVNSAFSMLKHFDVCIKKIQDDYILAACTSIKVAIDLIRTQFDNTLLRLNVLKIESNKGDLFDSNIHHSIDSVYSDKIANNVIVDIIQNGYVLNNNQHLIRPVYVLTSTNVPNVDNSKDKIQNL